METSSRVLVKYDEKDFVRSCHTIAPLLRLMPPSLPTETEGAKEQKAEGAGAAFLIFPLPW